VSWRRLSDQAWWTAADQAELDLLVCELVDAAYRHRQTCSEHEPRVGCRHETDAIQQVIGWRDHRILASKAAYLRHLENATEETTVATALVGTEDAA
jgi:hypothetical protein